MLAEAPDSSNGEGELRPLTHQERAVLTRLLDASFPGRQSLVTQSLGITGGGIDM